MLSKQPFLFLTFTLLVFGNCLYSQTGNVQNIDIMVFDNPSDSSSRVINRISFDQEGIFLHASKPFVTSPFINQRLLSKWNYEWLLVDVYHQLIHLPLIFGTNWLQNFIDYIGDKCATSSECKIKVIDNDNGSGYIEITEEIIQEEVFGKFIDEIKKEPKTSIFRLEYVTQNKALAIKLIQLLNDVPSQHTYMLLKFDNGQLVEVLVGSSPETMHFRTEISYVSPMKSHLKSSFFNDQDQQWVEQNSTTIRYQPETRMPYQIETFYPIKRLVKLVEAFE